MVRYDSVDKTGFTYITRYASRQSQVALRALALLLAFGAATGAEAQSRCAIRHYGWNLDVRFQKAAVAVLVHDRERLSEMKERAEGALMDVECCPRIDWRVEGHADVGEAGKSSLDLLSAERALFVQERLIALGVPAARICTKSSGAKFPVDQPPSARNSRVEVGASCATRREMEGEWC